MYIYTKFSSSTYLKSYLGLLCLRAKFGQSIFHNYEHNIIINVLKKILSYAIFKINYLVHSFESKSIVDVCSKNTKYNKRQKYSGTNNIDFNWSIISLYNNLFLLSNFKEEWLPASYYLIIEFWRVFEARLV